MPRFRYLPALLTALLTALMPGPSAWAQTAPAVPPPANRAAPLPAYWVADAAAQRAASASPETSRLAAYRAFTLDVAALRAQLTLAPDEAAGATGQRGAARPPVEIGLPLPDGSTRRFRLVRTQVMAPGLAARYPDIQTYAGVGVEDPTATVRCDVGPLGFHALLLGSEGGPTAIEAVSPADAAHYLAFTHRATRQTGGGCGTLDAADAHQRPAPGANPTSAAARVSGTTERTYRLALAVRGEFTALFPTTPTATSIQRTQAAVATLVNQANGIFQRDAGVRLLLVANNDQLIYSNGATDPYPDEDPRDENQTNLDLVLGVGTYDIGHVLSVGDDGVASIGSICNTNKAWGSSRIGLPVTGYRSAYITAHELAHQLGASHTFNTTAGACANAGQRMAQAAWEPGSGSTLMGYADVCAPDNLQPGNDLYFHAGTREEVLATLASRSCGSVAATGNRAPTLTLPPNRVLPIGTPFQLSATATDPDGHPLTYAWDEVDLGPAGPTPIASTVQVPGQTPPLVRSRPPTASGTRYVPALGTWQAGQLPWGEALPTVARTMTFRCLVRDQYSTVAAGGADGDVVLTFSSAAGPFVVTSPARGAGSNPAWGAGATQVVTWNVANTTAAPVSCPTVNILLSTDGGRTFPTTLAANVPNNGARAITVPNTAATNCYVMVAAANNIFYDVSGPFQIAGQPTLLGFTPGGSTANAGVTVTLTGAYLSYATAVYFGNGSQPAASFRAINGSQLEAVAPPGVTTGPIRVSTPAATVASSTAFQVVPEPTITGFAPASGVPGSSVTVTGTNLGGLASASIGGVNTAITANTATSVTLTVPPGPSGRIVLRPPFTAATSAIDFTVLVANAPTVTGVSPQSGAPGATITITGTNLTYVAAAELNGTPAPITGATPTSLTLTVPNVASGPLRLLGPGGYTSALDPFTVIPPTPDPWTWATTLGSGSGSLPNVTLADVARSPVGTLYVVGQFSGSAAFGATTLVAQGYTDGFVGALTSAGAWLWAERVGSSGTDALRAVAVDGAGTLTVGGYFRGQLPLGSITLRGDTTGVTAFVARRSPAGQWLWAASPTTLSPGITDLALDPAGNTYVVGRASARLQLGTLTLDAASADDFVARLSTTGAWEWAHRFAGGTTGGLAAIAVDPASGNVTVAGQCTGSNTPTTITLAGLTASGLGFSVGVVAQLTASGAGRWLVASRSGSSSSSGSCSATALALDAAGNAVVGGSCTGTLTWGTGNTLGNSNSYSDAFVVRLSGSTGTHQWSTLSGGPANEYLSNLAVGADGRIRATGIYSASLLGQTTTSIGSATLPFSGQQDLFAATLTSTGAWAWTTRIAGADTELADGLTLDGAGNAVVIGRLTTNAPVTLPGLPALTTASPAFIAQLGAAVPPAPTLTALSPTSARTGQQVTLFGTNLASVSGVTFNGVAAIDIASADATTIVVRVPGGATSGPVVVTTTGGTAGRAFTVLGPTITGFAPTSGGPGRVVSLIGLGLPGATAVRFGGVAATVFSTPTSQILTAEVPAGAVSGPIQVLTPAGNVTSAQSFTLISPPTISGFTPTSGVAGTVVTVNGANLADVVVVTVGGYVVNSTSQNATSLTFTVPAGAPSGQVAAGSVGGTGLSAGTFTVLPSVPTITAFTPASGGPGTVVSVVGTDFVVGATTVTFDNAAATAVTVLSGTQLSATAPAGVRTGRLRATTAAGTAVSATDFLAAPVVSGFSPASGAVGSTVVISGQNLSGATSVTLNGTPAPITASSATSLSCTVPVGATSGLLAVTTPGGGPVLSSSTFTVTGGGGTGPAGWPQAGGGANADHAFATATDGQGNVYVAGHFLNTATFGSVTLTAPGGSQDAFLVKYNATGAVQWAVRLGGVGSESIRGLTLDTNGQPYVTGVFANTFTYASAFGTQTLTNPNGAIARGFVAMCSSAGAWQWAVGFGSALPAAGAAVAIDFNGNLTVAGTFQGTLALESSALTLTSAGGTDGFAAQLNTGTGQWAWATRVGAAAYDALQGVTFSAQTNSIYAAGQFAGNGLTTTPTNGFNPLNSAGGADALLVRLNNATGAVAWLAQGGGAADDFATDVAVTGQGTVLVAAYGTGSGAFGNNPINLPNGGGWAGVAQLAAGGFWQQGLTTATCPPGNTVQTSRLRPDGTGGVTVTGFFGSSATFGTTSLSTPSAAPFVARTTSTGTAWAWAQQATPGSSQSFAYGEGLALTPNGLDAYVVGAFTGTLTQNGVTLTATGASADAFVARFTPPTGPTVPPAPTLSNLAPASGPVGTTVTVTGTNLSGATGVTFGGVAAAFSAGSATSLTATVPVGASTGPVVVTTAGGASNGLTFNVTGAVAEPVITTVTPGHAPVGAGVIITGTGFTNATLVRFNGRPAVFSVNGAGTQITATVPPDATTGPLAVTTPAGEAAASAPFGLDLLVTTVETLEFGSYYDVTITPTGAATLSSSGPNFGLVVAGTLRVQAGGSLDFNGQPVFGNGQFVSEAGTTLTLYHPEGLTLAPATQGDVQLTAGRTYSTDATYVFAGTGAAVTGAAFPATVRHLTLSGGNVTLTNALGIRQVLRLTGAGNLLTNGRMLTLLSDATTTAMLVNGGAGRVIGTATVERYITPNGVPGLGYRHLSSPTTASAVSDLAAPGFTPLVNPAYNALPYAAPPAAQFPNVFGFDETRGGITPAYQGFATGWVSPTALPNVLTPGRGYTVLLNGAVKPDFTGTLTQSDLTLTGLTRTGTGIGNDDKSGWHLLGNAFAAPLNWDLVPVPTGLSASISVYQTQGGNNGLYLTRANGIGSLPDGLIPAAQGFFTRVTGAGPVSLTLPSAARATTYANPAHYRAAPPAPDTRPLISLALHAVGADDALTDEAFVYFQPGATASTDDTFDGAKPGRNTGTVPTLVSLTTTGDELAVQGLSPEALTTGTIVPLLAVAPAAGNYTLKVSNLRNFDGQPLTLVDGLTGTRYDLRTQPALTFRADQPGEIRGRFRLEFGQRVLGTGADSRAAAAPLQVWPNPARATQTVQVSGLPANTQLVLLDATGRVVRTNDEQPATSNLPLRGLPPGVYVLRAGGLTQRLVVE